MRSIRLLPGGRREDPPDPPREGDDDGDPSGGTAPSAGPDRREGLHVAVVMDGNGRWAEARGRPRAAGHVAGAAAVRGVVEAAPDLGIATLTLYAFSADNWRRPPAETDHLMRLFRGYLRSECARMVESGVRLSVIGRRDRIPRGVRERIEWVERRTRSGARLHLRIAIDYSARDALLAAAGLVGGSAAPTRAAFERALARAANAPPGTADVDLLVRTGGERRLSDFLLWESAYAELLFSDTPWPDFTAEELESAVREFSGRSRRFGGLGDDPGGGAPADRERGAAGVRPGPRPSADPPAARFLPGSPGRPREVSRGDRGSE